MSRMALRISIPPCIRGKNSCRRVNETRTGSISASAALQIDLDTDVNRLVAQSTLSGDIDIDETSGIALDILQTASGSINVQADGTLWLTGRLIKRDQVIQKIQSIASKHPKGKLEVRIRGSKSAPYSSVEPIMLACTKAGVWNVVYAVYEKGQ